MSPGPHDNAELQRDLGEQLIAQDVGEEIFSFAARIFPICRSITGERRAGKRYAKSDRISRWRSAKFPQERRSLTGRSRASGTSATRT